MFITRYTFRFLCLLLLSFACGPSTVTTISPSPASRPASQAASSTSGSIKGSLKDQNSRILQDAVISFECTKPEYFAIDTTDAEGDFIASNLPFGSYKIQVQGWGISGNTTKKATIQPTVPDLTVDMDGIKMDWNKKGRAGLKVVVFDQSAGKVMSDALVELSFRGLVISQLRTNYNGEASFSNLPEDKVGMKVSAEKHNDALEKLVLSRSMDNSINIYLAPSLTVIKVRVLDKATGKPIPGVNIRSTIIEKILNTNINPTNDRGESSVSFSSTQLASEIPLDVNLIGYSPVVQTVQVNQNRENEYTVYLSQGETESGNVNRTVNTQINEIPGGRGNTMMDGIRLDAREDTLKTNRSRLGGSGNNP